MVRTVDKKLTFWLAGYYDDFTNSKAIPDDSNVMGSTWKSIETHHGNPLNGLAPYNPRYKYTWFIRGTGNASANFNGFTAMSATTQADRTLHNKKIGEWLTFDPEWYNQGQYEGATHIQYPDAKTNANRQKFDTAAGDIGAAYLAGDPTEGYLLFCNGYNTQGTYYAFTGNTDSSYGRDDMIWSGKLTGNALTTNAGEPTNATAPTFRVDTYLAGSYVGEIVNTDVINGAGSTSGANSFFKPIHSPSKTPFLIQEIYKNTSSGYFTTLFYQGSLNSKGNDDIFTVRIAPISVDTTPNVKLRVANSNNPIQFSSSTGGDTTSGTYAIEIDIDVKGLSFQNNFLDYLTDTIEANSLGIWDDYEIKLNFSSQNYLLFKNGVQVGGTTSFNAHPSGANWQPSDFYGWEVQAEDCDKKLAILLDRVGTCRYLNDYPLNTLTSAISDNLPIASNLSYSASVNTPSTVRVEVTDDESQLKLVEFFNQASYSDWSLLCFRDTIDRPFWRGGLDSMSTNYDANNRTPTIEISAKDHLSDLDHQIPIWELGEGGDADSTAVVAYNRQDSQNRISTYYFGASPLEVGNAGLGYNEIFDGTGVWESHIDSRMRLRSAHPIQIYNDEDTFGINEAYQEWDDAITDGYATTAAQHRSLHSRWIQDLPKSQWFQHMFGKIEEAPLVSTTSVGAFTPGDTSLTINAGGHTLANGGHIEFVDADGTVDSGVVSSATFTDTHTGIKVAWLHCFKTTSGVTDLTNTSSPIGGANSACKGVALVPTTIQLHNKIRRIRGCKWQIFNNEWGFNRVGITAKVFGVDYDIYTLRYPASVTLPSTANNPITRSYDWTTSGIGYIFDLVYSGQPFAKSRPEDNTYGTTIGGAGQWIITDQDGIPDSYRTNVWENPITNFLGNQIAPGLRVDASALFEFSRTGTLNSQVNPRMQWRDSSGNSLANIFVSVGKPTNNFLGLPEPVTDAVGGNSILALTSNNFFERRHDAGTTVNIINHSKDYKHCYVLWADMRNDGNANADGFFRKQEFGLLQPASQNYEVSLVFADQNTDSGQERQEFVDLINGEDYDLWQLDATADPITNQAWSAVSGGSNSESNSKYHNWEEKAGAFVVIDTSKFFNLNTYANGGMTGQVAGGKKEIGDYIVETEGFPILIDSYWKRASTVPLNIADYRAWSPYYYLTENTPTSLRESIKLGDRAVQLAESTIDIYGTQMGGGSTHRPTTCKIVSESKSFVYHFNAYRKLGNTASLNISSVDPTDSQTKPGFGFITGVTGQQDPLSHLRDGHYIKISSSTNSTDGTYRLQVHPDCKVGNGAGDITGNNWVGKIMLPDSTTILSAGTCTVELEHTYAFFRLLNLGKPSKTTTTIDEWDGSSYSGMILGSDLLVASSRTITANSTTNTLTLSAVAGTNDHTFTSIGFVKGMSIQLIDSVNTGNNGLYKIASISSNGLVITVEEGLEFTYSASSTVTVTDEYYNIHSADYLINYKAAGFTNLTAPAPATRNPLTGGFYLYEGARQLVDIESEDGATDAVVYGNSSSVFPMRLMMQMQGFFKNKASLSFFDSDKFRVTYLDSLTKNWLNQANLLGIPDIGTIPRTEDMNTTQKDALSLSRSGTIDAVSAGTTPGRNQIVCDSNHGIAVGNVVDIVSNNSLAPTVAPFTTQYTVVNVVNATTFEVETTNTTFETAGNGTGVWRLSTAIDSFGGVNDCRNTTIANIYSQIQQTSGVGEEGVRSVFSYYMSRDSKPAFRPTYSNGFIFNPNNIRISRLDASSGGQASNVRVFYGSEGNYVDHPAVALGAKPRWEIVQAPELSSKEEATIVAKQHFEKISKAPMNVTAEIVKLSNNHALDGSNDRMLYEARFGYIADQSRSVVGYEDSSGIKYDKAMFWTSLRGGNLFTGIQNALDGRLGGSDAMASATSPLNNYHWYGANSVSYAVQVVHIPHGMPKTSQSLPSGGNVKADGNLRVVIDIAQETADQELNEGSDIHKGTYIFRVMLLDYEYQVLTQVGTASLLSMSSVKVDSNGLYEIPIPATYWPAQTGSERILLSVNYDYLASLVKLRCSGSISNKRKNGNSFAGVTYSSTNDGSIFPLGVRSWSDIGYWGMRKEFYAPRLHIVDDLNFTVGTTLNYTNPRLDLQNESLSVKNISWTIDGRDTEKLTLTLERDVSRAAKGFAKYILPTVNMGGRKRTGTVKPAPPGFNNPLGRGGSNEGKPKQGTRTNKYGDEAANTRRSQELSPQISPPRDKTPDGNTSTSNSNMVIGSSGLSRNANRRIKGVMDLQTSVVGDNFSIPGQKKPAPAPRSIDAPQSIGSFVMPDSGNASITTDGFSLSAGGDPDGGNGVLSYSSMKVRLVIPDNTESKDVTIYGKVNFQHQETQVAAILYITATCVETGDSIQDTLTLQSTSIDSNPLQNQIFINGSIKGAEIAGNTIEVKFERESGRNGDTAIKEGVSISALRIASDRKSVQGKGKTSEFSLSL